MEEKFYHSKYSIWSNIIITVFLALYLTRMFLPITDQYGALKLGNLTFLIVIFLVLIIAFVDLFNWIRQPAVIITDEKAIFSRYLGRSTTGFLRARKIEIEFDKIVSVKVKVKKFLFRFNRRVDIEYKKANNKVALFSLYFYSIKNHEKLVEIIGKRVKFT